MTIKELFKPTVIPFSAGAFVPVIWSEQAFYVAVPIAITAIIFGLLHEDVKWI